jgi:hypothetical protein
LTKAEAGKTQGEEEIQSIIDQSESKLGKSSSNPRQPIYTISYTFGSVFADRLDRTQKLDGIDSEIDFTNETTEKISQKDHLTRYTLRTGIEAVTLAEKLPRPESTSTQQRRFCCDNAI